MAPMVKLKKSERARQVLKGGGVIREDSDDELGSDDLPWEWIEDEEESEYSKKRKSSTLHDNHIIGARMGRFDCRLGDTVLLKAEGGQAWVGIIAHFFEEQETGEKMANFMWFSTPSEIRNKTKRRTDSLEHELYITAEYDDNPLSSINGKALIMSEDAFAEKFPKGNVPRNSRYFGKVFICRRGCNTRTATYTEEFIWETTYQGFDYIHDIEDIVLTQTKETRKKKARKAERDLDDFVAGDDEDANPRTPKKKRKFNDAVTPTSKHKNLTPRKFITPTHKRIIVKKNLEFTPLGTRILSPTALSSPFQQARTQLHVSSVPDTLPCREEEFAEVYSTLENAISAGTGSCIYIAGMPGTGKTATVREVIAQLNASVAAEELDDFIFVEINGMKVTDPHQSYSLLWEALREERVSPSHALELLNREFSTPSPRRVPCVVLMDELDQLVTKNQSVMYNFFNWPNLQHSRLIVLAVANTMDLPERTLSNKISSRLGLNRIIFPGYQHDQLVQIIASRLANVPGALVHPDAIEFASRKVAAVSGDARRALDICRRAVEIAEAEHAASTTSTEETQGTPSKSRRGVSKAIDATPAEQITIKRHIVTIATVKQAINEAITSPLQQSLRSLPLSAKLFLSALLARVRQTGVREVSLGDILDQSRKMALMSHIAPIHECLLLEGKDDVSDGTMTSRTTAGKGKGTGAAPRVLGMESAVMILSDAGILHTEARRGERGRKVRLGVGDEEVRLALKDDSEVGSLGFGS